MSLPRFPGRDLRLERLEDRDGLRRAYLGEVAQVRTLEATAQGVGEFRAAYQALIDAAFTGPGAAEWLSGMRRRVAAILAGQDTARQHVVAGDAICAATSAPRRS